MNPALSSGGKVRQQMLLSLGWRGVDFIRSAIDEGFSKDDHFVRGTSALALAHLCGSDALNILTDCADEAANAEERVFMLAAQIHAGASGRGDALHNELQQFKAFDWLPPIWKREILSAMALADGDNRRAEPWAEVAGERLDRILAQVRELRAARGIG